MPTTTATGPAELVNDLPANDQYEPWVRQLVGGGYVITWIDFTTSQVKFKLFDPNGLTVLDDSFASFSAGGTRRSPALLELSDGGFIISWTEESIFGDTKGFFQRFDGLGNAVGDTTQIDSTQGLEQFNVEGVPFDDGGFFFGYDSLGTSLSEVQGQRYDVSGIPVGTPITINTTTAGQQGSSVLTQTPTGFSSSWVSQSAGQFNVYQQSFDVLGAKLGSETLITTLPAAPQGGLDKTALDSGNIIHVFVRPGTPPQLVAVFGTDPPVVIADVPDGILGEPSITTIPGEGFLVTWITNSPVGPDPMLGRAYDAGNGLVPFGNPFTIADNARFTINGSVASLQDGRAIFVWDGSGPGDVQGIFSRIFQLNDFGNTPTSGNDDLWDPQQPPNLPAGAAGIVGIGAGTGPSNIDGLAGDDTIRGYDGDDILTGNDGNDRLFGGTGNDVMNGGAGNDFGLIDNPLDSFTGGDGIDTAGVQGNFIGTLGIDATTEVVLVASGVDTRFGDYTNSRYDYTLTLGALTVQQLSVQAAGLLAGEDLTLNAAALQGQLRVFAGAGLTVVTGGVGSDGVFFGTPAAYDPANSFIAGGNVDSLAFRGNYVGGTALVFGNASFTGVEVVALLSGLTNEFGGFIHPAGFDYALTMADGNVLAGQTLDINGNKLGALESVNVNASAELDGAYRFFLGAGNDTVVGSAGADLIFGNLGADTLDGGGGADTYAYRSTGESTAASQDAIVLGAGDKLDLSRIDANTGTPENDAFAFIGSAAFGNVAGQLRVAGGLIQADVNGDGVADLQIAFTGTPPAAPDFVL